MNGDKQYKYIFSVTSLMHERGKKRVVEITKNGKCIEHSKAGKEIPIQPDHNTECTAIIL